VEIVAPNALACKNEMPLIMNVVTALAKPR
jgi:hypothetical protein